MNFKSGDVVELAVQANLIPPGRYRFQEQQDEVMVLTVGKDILIGLCTRYWSPFLKKVPDGNAIATPAKKFVRQYFEAVAEFKDNDEPISPERMTFCVMAPHYVE